MTHISFEILFLLFFITATAFAKTIDVATTYYPFFNNSKNNKSETLSDWKSIKDTYHFFDGHL